MNKLIKNLKQLLKSYLMSMNFIKLIQIHRTKNNYKNSKINIFNKFDKKESFIIHIPKTAGTSVTKSIYGTDANFSHYTWEDLFIILNDNYSKYYSFSIVRNPWDRCLSAYEFLKLGGDNEKDRVFYEKNMSEYQTFSEFIKRGLSTKKIFNWIHFIPQSNFIFSKSDECMVNQIIRFENLENDYDFIKNKLGGSELLKYKINRTNHNYQKFYDKEMVNIISRLYYRDIMLLDYHF